MVVVKGIRRDLPLALCFFSLSLSLLRLAQIMNASQLHNIILKSERRINLLDTRNEKNRHTRR